MLFTALMKSDSEARPCSVCGGAMRMARVVSVKLGTVKRYKCTCGHSEDVKEDRQDGPRGAFVLEGFQEMP